MRRCGLGREEQRHGVATGLASRLGLAGRAGYVGMTAWGGWELGSGINWGIESTVGSPGEALFDMVNPESYSPEACPEGEPCPPCNPAAGTIGYRYGKEGTAPHYNKYADPALGAVIGLVPTPHLNLHQQSQSPRKAGCKCWWRPLKIAVPPPAHPEWVLLPPSRSGR